MTWGILKSIVAVLSIAAIVLPITLADTVIASTCQASIDPRWPLRPGTNEDFIIYIVLTPGQTESNLFIYRVFVTFEWDNEIYEAMNMSSDGVMGSSVFHVKPGQTVNFYLNDVSIPKSIEGGRYYKVRIDVVWGYDNYLYTRYAVTVNTTVYMLSNQECNISSTNQSINTALGLIIMGLTAIVAILLAVVAILLDKMKKCKQG